MSVVDRKTVMPWCGNNIPPVKCGQAEEIVVDFRRTRTKVNTISILGEEVEMVKEPLSF